MSTTTLSEELLHLESTVPRDPQLRLEPKRIRAALELLRLFGRRLANPLPESPTERSQLPLRLKLEHRWCYAAAGTTRAAFDKVTGRTGAR